MPRVTMNSTKAQIFAALEANQAEVTKLRAAVKFEQDNAELISEQWHEMNDANEELKFDAQVWRSKAEELQQQLYDVPQDISDLARELQLTKRQLADVITDKGILMNQLATQQPDIPDHVKEQVATLVDERDELIAENQRLVESTIAAHERCDVLEAIVAAQPRNPKPAPKPLPSPAQFDVEPAIQITDRDKIVYAKFQALPREQKQAYYDFAHSNGFGHLGIHNVNEIRIAFLAAKEAVA